MIGAIGKLNLASRGFSVKVGKIS
jgi:ATP synthase F1 beta subunit